MTRGGAITLGLVVTATLAGAVAVGVGRVGFDRRVERAVADLFATAGGTRPSVVRDDELAGLPAPVQRWLRRSGVVGRERPVAIRLTMAGAFRLTPNGPWMPLTAEEYYTTDPPAFVWAATIVPMPLLSFSVLDRYTDGHGALDGRLLALVPVVNARGPGLDQGALLRYLNETMWFPAAALSPCITWQEGDAISAKATMHYGDSSASATFVFDERGDLIDMLATRYHDATASLQPWSTPLTDYGEFEGIRVPVAGEGIWTLSDGDFAYIRPRITAIEYNRPERW